MNILLSLVSKILTAYQALIWMASLHDFFTFLLTLNQWYPCSCNFICDKTKQRISFEIVRYMSLEMVSATQICGFHLPTKPCVCWTCRAVSLRILLKLNSFNFYIIRGDFPIATSKFPAVAPEAFRLIHVFVGQFSILTQALLCLPRVLLRPSGCDAGV